MKRPDSVNQADGGGGPPSDPKFAAAHPNLWEYLTVCKYDDGSPRVTATVTLFVEDGVCKGCLNDRDTGRTGWASAAGVDGLFKALEKGLAAGSLDWRRKPQGGGASRGRKGG